MSKECCKCKKTLTINFERCESPFCEGIICKDCFFICGNGEKHFLCEKEDDDHLEFAKCSNCEVCGVIDSFCGCFVRCFECGNFL